jgi:hypothetical protein
MYDFPLLRHKNFNKRLKFLLSPLSQARTVGKISLCRSVLLWGFIVLAYLYQQIFSTISWDKQLSSVRLFSWPFFLWGNSCPSKHHFRKSLQRIPSLARGLVLKAKQEINDSWPFRRRRGVWEPFWDDRVDCRTAWLTRRLYRVCRILEVSCSWRWLFEPHVKPFRVHATFYSHFSTF